MKRNQIIIDLQKEMEKKLTLEKDHASKENKQLKITIDWASQKKKHLNNQLDEANNQLHEANQRFSELLDWAYQDNIPLKNKLDKIFGDLRKSSQQLDKAALCNLMLKNVHDLSTQENNQLRSHEEDIMIARAESEKHLVLKMLLDQQLIELRAEKKTAKEGGTRGNG
jgi:hypothetical protein